MYAASACRRVPSSAARGLQKLSRRRVTTEATPTPASPPPSTPPGPIPKKKKGVVRRALLYGTAAGGVFYTGSALLAFHHQPYYDFFVDHAPLGQTVLEFAEARGWDSFATAPRDTTVAAVHAIRRILINRTGQGERGGGEVDTIAAQQDSRNRMRDVLSTLKITVERSEDALTHGGAKAAALARHRAAQFSEGVEELVREAEDALAGNYAKGALKPVDSAPDSISPPASIVAPASIVTPSANESSPETGEDVYDLPIPLGFEPPPGYSRPSPQHEAPKLHDMPWSSDTPTEPTPLSLPAAPAVLEPDASDPVIAHLAATIEALASHLPPTSAGILEAARGDVAKLATRIEAAKEEEWAKLEARMDEQVREQNLKLLELQMEAEDKLADQQEEFMSLFELERSKIIDAYRERLDQELQVQTDLINERLKEELIAQGIAMQRRWLREVKVHVERERGGRLARLDELAAGVKRLERVTRDTTAYLDEALRLHALWSAVRALQCAAVDAPTRTPFRSELRRVLALLPLRVSDSNEQNEQERGDVEGGAASVSTSASATAEVAVAVLEPLQASDVPDVGVEPLADLTSWFMTAVVPHVSEVALVPDGEDDGDGGGVLAHLASRVLSALMFRRRGLVEGDDVMSVLARAEHFLNEKDLDSAARELNQLRGTARMLLKDWLDAARRRLEVEQALEVVEMQARLASLQVI